MKNRRSALDQIEFMRNLLAFVLVGAFVSMLPALITFGIPEKNEQLLTYMLGQLSGMATLALGFYFVNKVGQDAIDATRAENTGKLADLATTAMKQSDPVKAEGEAADQVVDAAAGERDKIKGELA